MKTTSANSGKQAGDPVCAANAMLDLTMHGRLPRHLVLSAWGVEVITGKLREQLDEIAA